MLLKAPRHPAPHVVVGDGGLHRVQFGTSKHITAKARDELRRGQRGRAHPTGPGPGRHDRRSRREDDRAEPRSPGRRRCSRLSGAAATAPSRPPVAPMPNARPIVPADSPRFAAGEQHQQCLAIKLKKFTVVAQPRLARRYGCRAGSASRPAPAASKRVSDARRPRPGSTSSRPIWKAENTNDNASTRIATGAVSHCISTPPTAGPPMNEIDRVADSLLFASRNWSRPTSRTKNDAYAVLNTTCADAGQDRDHVELAERQHVQPVRRRER